MTDGEIKFENEKQKAKKEVRIFPDFFFLQGRSADGCAEIEWKPDPGVTFFSFSEQIAEPGI